MNITGTQSTQSIYESYSQQNSKPAARSTPKSTANTDSVSISDAAKDIAKNGPYQLWDGYADKDLMCLPEEFCPYVLEPAKLGMKLDPDRSAAYGRLSAGEREDLSEYISAVSKCCHEERNARGIQNQLDFQALIKNDNELSNDIHQAIRERMLADPRTVELMKEFEIAL